MEASPVRVIQYFDGIKQNLIPLFQRPYTWERRQWTTFWEDVLDQYHEGVAAKHFMGAVVSIPQNSLPIGVSKHLIIDGQQRLTTLAILLCALRSSLDDRSGARIEDYLINRHADGLDKLKLLPTHGDREVYRHLVIDNMLPTEPHLIKTGYEFFRKKIAEKDREGLVIDGERLLITLERCLQVVMINLGDTDDPYAIFDSLNSKGTPLTQSDLIRNYVLMRFRYEPAESDGVASPSDQERVYDTLWKPMEDALKINETDHLSVDVV